MATFKKTLSGDSRYRIELKVIESNTNISTNTSDVDYELAAYKSSGSGYYALNKTNPIKVVIDGATIVNKNIAYDFRNTTKIVLASGTVRDIQHNADGTKTIQCSGYFKDNENSLGSATASGSLTLTQLHKAPVPSIVSIYEQDNLLRRLGLTNTFVANVSSKSFTLSAEPYDEAQIESYTLTNGSNSVTTSTSNVVFNFKLYPLTIINNKVPIVVTATDDMGGVGSTTIEYENYIPYFKPTLIQSNLKTPRDGQLTGKAKLIANGTYFNGNVGTISVTPIVRYRYTEKGTNNFSNWIETIPTYQNGTWELEADIGAERGTSETPPSNWFDPEKMYEVQVIIIDTLQTQLTIQDFGYVYTSTILLGDAIMTKYKDRVDFKKITINGEEITFPKVLYQGNASATLTLNDTYTNYKYIEIFYCYNDDTSFNVCKIPTNIGSRVQLVGDYDNGSILYHNVAIYNFSGTTLTKVNEVRWRYEDGAAVRRTNNTTDIKIRLILGYK